MSCLVQHPQMKVKARSSLSSYSRMSSASFAVPPSSRSRSFTGLACAMRQATAVRLPAHMLCTSAHGLSIALQCHHLPLPIVLEHQVYNKAATAQGGS